MVPKDLERVSVIARTPSRVPNTSTPASSPTHNPVPPRICQTIGSTLPAEFESHSPSCSELSDVFLENQAVSKPSVSLSISKPDQVSRSVVFVSSKMQDAEKEIILKQTYLFNKMDLYDADSVNEYSIHRLEKVQNDVDTDFLAVQQAIDGLLHSHSQELGQIKVAHYEAEKQKNAANYKEYKRRVDQQAILVRRSSSQVQNVSDLGQNLNDPSSFQSQQLQIMKQQNEIFERQESGRHNETLNQTEARKNAAVAKVKNKAELIFKHARELDGKVSK